MTGIVADRLQRRVMLGLHLWRRLRQLGRYLRRISSDDEGRCSDPVRRLRGNDPQAAYCLDRRFKTASNPHGRVALRDDSQYLATIDLTFRGKLYAH